MTIGELLKDYRLGQRKTQKQWAGTVISPSFYAKVEKNLSRISSDDLVDLLHENNVNLIEFFGKLNRQDRSVEQQKIELNRLINDAYYQNEQKDLQQIRSMVAESQIPNKEDELLLIDAYIAIGKGKSSKLDPELVAKMKEKVFDIINFDEDSLIVYVNFMTFCDLSSNLIISKRVIKEFIGTSNTRIQQILLGIAINMLILCFENKAFSETDFYIKWSSKIESKPDTFFYKMAVATLAAILRYRKWRRREDLEEAEYLIKGFARSGMDFYAGNLENILLDNK